MLISLQCRDTKRVADKLHRQFGHPSAEKLIKVVENAGIKSVELLNSIRWRTENCDICVKLKKTPPRPIVSMPIANSFNDVISMDLKQWRNQYFFVMVDVATIFCSAVVINNKCSSTILKFFFSHWIAFFGPPKKILSDNGCEFSNSEVREFG